jgi:hypothetical protein
VGLRTRVFAGLVAVTLLCAVAASAATAFSQVPDGFTASLVVDSLPSSCDGNGASAVATDGSTHYFAIDGSLYYFKSALRTYSGGVEPWGIALAGGSLYATQPGCDTSQADRAPGALVDCNVVLVSTENGDILRTIRDDVCGTGIAARGSTLAVATRDGRIVTVNVSGGAMRDVATDLRPVATQLAWSPDGGTIFFTRKNGNGLWSVPASGGGDVRRVASVAADGLIAGTTTTGAAGKVLVAGAGKLNLVKVDTGATTEVGAASALAGPMAVAGKKILVAMTEEAWVLSGAFPGPSAPRAPRRPVAAVPPAAPRTLQGAPPPPPVLPQAPPPPVPPAPPAPVQAFIAQPSAVTNPALVPAKEEAEGALRHAATGRRSTPALEIWLAIVAAGTVVGYAGFSAGRSRPRAGMAWAVASGGSTHDRRSMLR